MVHQCDCQRRRFKLGNFLKGQNILNEFLNRFFQSLGRIITSVFCKCEMYGLKSLLSTAVFIDDPSKLHFRTAKPCRSIYSNITLCGWVVINPVIAHSMPGIIPLIITICLTSRCLYKSICPLHVLGGKIQIPHLNWRYGNLLLNQNNYAK